MQASSYMLAHELANSERFNDLLKEFIKEQKELRCDAMRSAVKRGSSLEATLVEGEMALLERLPYLFRYYGEKYKPS